MVHRRSFPTALAAGCVCALLSPANSARAADAVGGSAPPDSAADSVAVAAPPADHGLGPTSDPPWNPSQAISREEPWEFVLRLPGRIISIPFALLGLVTPVGLLAIEQSYAVPRTTLVLATLPRLGLVIVPGSQGDDTGTGLSARFEPPSVSNWFRAEHQASTLDYHRTRLTLIGGPARLGYIYEWRPTDGYFGLGDDTRIHNASQYAVQGEELRLSATAPLRLGGRRDPQRNYLTAWAASRTRTLTSGREEFDPDESVTRRNRPSIENAYPEYAARMGEERANLMYGAELALDRRTGRPHWTNGTRVKLGFERYDEPLDAFVFGHARVDGPQYTRYRAEFEGGVSFGRSARTFRLLLRASDDEVSAGSQPFDPFDYSRLGGSEGLAGYQPRRFHDLDALSGRLTYLFPLTQHFEMAVFGEGGNVYRDLQHDARLDSMKSTWGFELRPRTKFAPLGAIGVAFSPEGTRYTFSFGGVE
jgi:hypothetical protein